MKDNIQRLIDWELDYHDFQREIRKLIHDCDKNHKVIPLPLSLDNPQVAVGALTFLLADMHCDDCKAPCCRANEDGSNTRLLPPEYERLSAKYGPAKFIVTKNEHYLPMPCPFLRSDSQGRGVCGIYRERPLVCTFYPYQPGGYNGLGQEVFAVSSRCPEARRIARKYYLVSWQIRRHYGELDEISFFKEAFNWEI